MAHTACILSVCYTNGTYLRRLSACAMLRRTSRAAKLVQCRPPSRQLPGVDSGRPQGKNILAGGAVGCLGHKSYFCVYRSYGVKMPKNCAPINEFHLPLAKHPSAKVLQRIYCCFISWVRTHPEIIHVSRRARNERCTDYRTIGAPDQKKTVCNVGVADGR